MQHNIFVLRTSKLRPSTAKQTAYGGHTIPILGKSYLQCQYKSSKQVIEFHIVKNGKSLLGCTSCKSLKLITFHNVDQLQSTDLITQNVAQPVP